MVHHVRVGQTPDSLEAREMINERACELLQAVQGSELRSGDDLEGFLDDLGGFLGGFLGVIVVVVVVAASSFLVLSGKMMVGRKSQIFLQIYTGQTTVRDSRKFDEKFEELFFSSNFGNMWVPEGVGHIFWHPKCIWADFRPVFQGSNLMKNMSEFPPHQPYSTKSST